MSAELKVLDAEPLGQGITELLEDLLERAKQGEFSSMAVAYVFRDGAVGSCNSTPPSRPLLVGAVEYMKHSLIERGIYG